MQDNKFDNQFLENLSDSHRDITSTSSMTSSKLLDLTLNKLHFPKNL